MFKINGKYDIPSGWEELTPEQYVSVIGIFGEFELGRIDFGTMKTRVTLSITGISRPDPENAVLCENIYRISEHLTFLYRFRYDDPKFPKLSPEIQEALRKRLPSSMDSDDPEVRIARTFRPKVEPDLCFARQLLPELPCTGAKGYTFLQRGPLVETSLTAAQYIDANSLVSLLNSGTEEQETVLDSLVSVLYAPQPYTPDSPAVLAGGKISYDVKLAVMYNYISIAEWISRLPQYDLIFHGTGKKKKAGILGAGSSLMSLSEKGYGDYASVGRMNLFTYLDILLKMTVDAVTEMNAYKMKPSEIADRTHLTLEQINTILK